MKRADEVSENEKTGEGESVTFPTSILINSILPKENKPIAESLESPAIINRPIKPLSIRKVVEGEKEVPPVQVKLSTAQVGSLRHFLAFFLVVSSKDKTVPQVSLRTPFVVRVSKGLNCISDQTCQPPRSL